MSFITRKDGERFVIPSYRDLLGSKKTGLLKKEIQLLASNYGEYVVMQRKNITQFEVAFSPDPGYLLGETVWHYFKRPYNLIYCEMLPESMEAILVIVKGNSVYLDGVFPLDSIPDELLVLKTQNISFDFFIYGDVPISQVPEEGKFFLDASFIHSFTVLDHSAFASLPTHKSFQLQPIDLALKTQGIGVLPIKWIVSGIILAGIFWLMYLFISVHEKELPTAFVGVVSPYQAYQNALTTPDPAHEIQFVADKLNLLYTIPGWSPDSIKYNQHVLVVSVKSAGTRGTSELLAWANRFHFKFEVLPEGFFLSTPLYLLNRTPPDSISQLQSVLTSIITRLSAVFPGNNVILGSPISHFRYTEMMLTVNITGLSPDAITLIGQQFNQLPVALTSVTLTNSKGKLNGTIVLNIYGN